MDEMPKQLLNDIRDHVPVCPGQPAREDYEYQRESVADFFMLFEPCEARCLVERFDFNGFLETNWVKCLS
jgi:hypothetical protein